MKRRLKQNAIKCLKWEHNNNKKGPEERDDVRCPSWNSDSAATQSRIQFSGSLNQKSELAGRLSQATASAEFIQQFVIEVSREREKQRERETERLRDWGNCIQWPETGNRISRFLVRFDSRFLCFWWRLNGVKPRFGIVYDLFLELCIPLFFPPFFLSFFHAESENVFENLLVNKCQRNRIEKKWEKMYNKIE